MAGRSGPITPFRFVSRPLKVPLLWSRHTLRSVPLGKLPKNQILTRDIVGLPMSHGRCIDISDEEPECYFSHHLLSCPKKITWLAYLVWWQVSWDARPRPWAGPVILLLEVTIVWWKRLREWPLCSTGQGFCSSLPNVSISVLVTASVV